uniref:Transposase n=1 Tax=Panagrellus redivivus TaxID=6233 RepID=A0A7E4V359_PANRE
MDVINREYVDLHPHLHSLWQFASLKKLDKVIDAVPSRQVALEICPLPPARELPSLQVRSLDSCKAPQGNKPPPQTLIRSHHQQGGLSPRQALGQTMCPLNFRMQKNCRTTRGTPDRSELKKKYVNGEMSMNAQITKKVYRSTTESKRKMHYKCQKQLARKTVYT